MVLIKCKSPPRLIPGTCAVTTPLLRWHFVQQAYYLKTMLIVPCCLLLACYLFQENELMYHPLRQTFFSHVCAANTAPTNSLCFCTFFPHFQLISSWYSKHTTKTGGFFAHRCRNWYHGFRKRKHDILIRNLPILWSFYVCCSICCQL